MIKERLEEIKENWNNVVWGIDKSDINWLIKQAERAQELDNKLENVMDSHTYLEGRYYELEHQNKRYRNLLESISTTNKVASEIFNKKDGKTLISPDDILQEILRKVNKRLESELNA